MCSIDRTFQSYCNLICVSSMACVRKIIKITPSWQYKDIGRAASSLYKYGAIFVWVIDSNPRESITGIRKLDNEPIEVVEHLKYLGSLKSAYGNCNKDTRSRIGMAKKRLLDLVPIWKDRGINKDLKMKQVRSLVWTVLASGSEGWTLKKLTRKGYNQQKCEYIVGCYESVGLNTEQTKASS